MTSLQKPISKSIRTDLNDREYKTTIMKKCNEIQKVSERQFNELRSKINEKKEHLTKEIETKNKPNRNSRAKLLTK